MNRPVIVVGPSARFLSGISYSTAALTKAFHEHGPGGAALLIRQLCPAAIYPGRQRIGRHDDTTLDFGGAPHHAGLDWFWGFRTVRSLVMLWRRRPSTVVLQWWTGTTAHTYLLVAFVAKLRGALVTVEAHEILDVGEASKPAVRRYVHFMMGCLLRMCDGVIVHSEGDIEAFHREYPKSRNVPACVIPLGPLHLEQVSRPPGGPTARLVHFGVLRDYKGVEELAEAYRILRTAGVDVELTVAGEPWDANATHSVEQLGSADGVTLHLGYLNNEELEKVVTAADLVVLPYRRSSASGPLHVAMANGIPVVTTALPALMSASAGYTGVRFAEPCNATSLAETIVDALPLIGERHESPHTWDDLIGAYLTFFSKLGKNSDADRPGH